MAEFKVYKVTLEIEVHTNVDPNTEDLGSKLAEDINRILEEGNPRVDEGVSIVGIEYIEEYD